MFDPASVRFRGPLRAHVDGFWAALQSQGYAPLSGRNLLLVAAHFSRWLHDHRLELGDLTEERVALFLAHRRRRGYTQFLSPRALGPLLGYLCSIGIVVRATAVVETSIDRLLREYAEYLARERCLSTSTIRGYTDFAREFARVRCDTKSPGWDQLTPSDIADFVTRESRRWSIGSCKLKVTGLRSLLRFLHVRGDISRNLADCVPAVAGWRLAWLPRALEPDQVERLFHSSDQRSTVGLRDAAIVRLLVRLGLRAGEVAALTLDDLDWRAGEIVVHGKGARESRLPLPQDVGQQLAAYLKHARPCVLTRTVFLCSRAPYRTLGPSGVAHAVGRALRRAGVTAGAHVLRHTAATQMLRKGASLSEVAHVLRHRHIDTTAIYAKVDHVALRTVARPWPQGAA